MNERDAFYLLFNEKFKGSPLFRNQVDLVNDLINLTESTYYTDKSHDEYQRRTAALKVYISQLFSGTTRRAVTSEFKKSLLAIVNKRLANLEQSEMIVDQIIHDLIEKNSRLKIEVSKDKESTPLSTDFLSNITAAKYISVFSAREIKYEITIQSNRIPFARLLLEDLVRTLIDGKVIKSYRFNFPLSQTCMLFWIGVQKEIAQYLHIHNDFLEYAIEELSNRKVLEKKDQFEKEGHEVEQTIASEILNYLSKKQIIRVFHITVPVFLIPFITIDPNDQIASQTYCVFQGDRGEDVFHKLSNTELVFWKLFVWDNLRLKKFGKEITYDEYTKIG